MRKTAYAERRRLVNYLQATQNEIALDLIALEVAGVDPARCGYFPRASKWIGYVARRRRLLRILWLLAAPAWRFGGAAIFHLVECLRYARHARRCRAGGPAVNRSAAGGYVLALSSRVGDIVRPPAIPTVPTSWLTLPWAPLRALPAGFVAADMFSLLTSADLWKCYARALLATRVLGRRARTRLWVLQSYTALRWFAVWTALERLSGEMLMAEHYDRWAILVDCVVLAKRRGSAGPGPLLTLVQHGEIGGLSPAAWRTGFYAKLRRKLRTVSVLYAYDRASADIFRSSLMTARCARSLQVNYYRPLITLQSHAPLAGRSVLFVGHPLCEALHVHLLERLMMQESIDVFYKPHPEARMSPGIADHAWSVVHDRYAFPAVDLLISYPSTLVTEYAALGVPAAVHPLYLSVADADDFVAQVQRLIRELSSREAREASGTV